MELWVQVLSSSRQHHLNLTEEARRQSAKQALPLRIRRYDQLVTSATPSSSSSSSGRDAYVAFVQDEVVKVFDGDDDEDEDAGARQGGDNDDNDGDGSDANTTDKEKEKVKISDFRHVFGSTLQCIELLEEVESDCEAAKATVESSSPGAPDFTQMTRACAEVMCLYVAKVVSTIESRVEPYTMDDVVGLMTLDDLHKLIDCVSTYNAQVSQPVTHCLLFMLFLVS